MISIVIPVYNTENFLDRCLKSVCNQTYKNLEILCVNDGSTDNSLKILHHWLEIDKRIKVINKKNGGLASARNAGIKSATGNWIYFIDSDDYIDLNFCEELLNCVKSHNADFAICPTMLSDINHNLVILPPYHEFIYTSFKEKVRMFRGGSCCDKLFSMKLLNKYNITFEEGHNWEGNLFLLKVAKYSDKFASTMKTFYHYIYNQNSICHSVSDESRRIEDRLFVLDSIFQWVKVEKLSHRNMRAVLSLIERSVVDGGFYKKYLVLVIKKIGIKNYLIWRFLKKFKKIQ